MRRYPILVTVAAAALLTGCSPTTEQPTASTSITTSPASSESTPQAQEEQVPDGAVQVSPGGVTTGVGAPADATESGYGQACLAAKAWFDEQAGDPLTQVEAYLQTLQVPGAVGPGTLDTPWPQLSPGQQAAVIMAADAAANQQCG